MANKYLISAMVNNVETFYTANPNGEIIAIGTTLDWERGFDDYTLSCIDNSVYSTLDSGKVWVNNNVTMASEETTGESFVYTTDETAFDCKGYSGLSSLKFNFDNTPTNNEKNKIKIALSFNNRNTYYTRGQGYVANSQTAIPTTAADRETAGINIDEESFSVLFDGNTETMLSTRNSSVTVPIEFTNGIVARKYDIIIPQSCRLPLIAKFQVYDSDNSSWLTLDEITIKASKTISRYFDNTIDGITYRWVFEADPTDIGDDPTRSIDISVLKIYGRTTGTVWIPLEKPEDVKTSGLTLTEVETLTSDYYTQIFDQTQIDYVLYIPEKFSSNISSIVANFPTNGAPVIEYFRALSNKIHSGDVDVIFNISDPEGGNVNYKIFVNNQLVITRYNAISNKDTRETIPNSAFKEIDDTTTNIVEATNTIRIEVEDEYGASASETYVVTKIDKYPSLIGTLDEDTYTYTFTIYDADNDKVKYAAYINEVETPISTSTFLKVPTNELSFDIPQNHIKFGKTNTLKIVLTDSVLGETTVLVTFEGTYPSILFYNENGELLSTNFGEVITKLDLGVMCCGQISVPVKVIVNNNTSKSVKDLVINSPKDIDGQEIQVKENGVLVGTIHQDGNTWVQLSTEENFVTPSTYYSISLDNLSAHESKEFFVRVQSKSALANPTEFDNIRIDATSTVVSK